MLNYEDAGCASTAECRRSIKRFALDAERKRLIGKERDMNAVSVINVGVERNLVVSAASARLNSALIVASKAGVERLGNGSVLMPYA